MRYGERPTNVLIKPAKYFSKRFVVLVLFMNLRHSIRPNKGWNTGFNFSVTSSFVLIKIDLTCIDLFMCNIFRLVESGRPDTIGRNWMPYLFCLFCPSLIAAETDIATSLKMPQSAFGLHAQLTTWNIEVSILSWRTSARSDILQYEDFIKVITILSDFSY
jgi:hypothetical protein